MTNRRRDRSADITAPAPMIRDEEVSQEVLIRRLTAAPLNMRNRDTTIYSWETAVRSRTRTAPVPPNFVAPEGL